jgi:hypothetical protein
VCAFPLAEIRHAVGNSINRDRTAMHQLGQRSREPNTPQPSARKVKRYGWYRTYEDFIAHPKWRLVAAKADVPLTQVHSMAQALFSCASKNRKNGWIGNFDPFECAVTLDISPDAVARVYLTFEQIDWVADGYIVDWADRNPDQEDPTAAERQRNARARKIARRKFAAGQTLTDTETLLLSRVTGFNGGEPPRATEALGVFEIVDPHGDGIEEINAAKVETARRARLYLFGNGTATDWGPASAVVADKMGMRRMAADTTIRRWLGEVSGDLVVLATIIDGANHDGLRGESFEAVLRQAIGRVVREKNNGGSLLFPPSPLKGGSDE